MARKTLGILGLGLGLMAAPMVASAAVIVLDFEGVGNLNPVGNFYNGGGGPNYGIAFSPDTLAIVDFDAGGTGNIANEPSPDTVMFFLDSSNAILNFAAGFYTGFSFFYSSSTTASVNVYDGLGATGNVLGTLNLNAQFDTGCVGDPNGNFCNWTPVGVNFAGIAKSIDFGRVSGRLGLSLLRAPVERKGQQLDYATSRLARAIGSSIDLQRNRMERPRLTAAMLEIPIREARRKLDYASRMLADRRGSGFERAAARLEQASRLLTSFSHEGTLARGFALLRDAGGNVITRASQTAAGAAYGLSFADGTIDVVRVDGAAAKPAPRKAGAKPKPVAATGGGDQGDLF